MEQKFTYKKKYIATYAAQKKKVAQGKKFKITS